MQPMMYCSPVTVPMMVCQAPPMQFLTRRPPSLTILAKYKRQPEKKIVTRFVAERRKEGGVLAILFTIGVADSSQ